MAEAKGVELTQVRVEIYLADLADLDPDVVVQAIEQLRRESDYFPQICHIREKVLGKLQDNEQAEAESAWVATQRYVEKYYHPDLGLHGPKGAVAPSLGDRVDFAIRACGGIESFYQRMFREDGVSFLRREFVEAYLRAPQVAEIVGGLSDRQLLSRITEQAGLKAARR